MSLVVLPFVALVAGLIATLLAWRAPAWATWIGLAGAAASVALALRVGPEDAVLLGGITLTGSDLIGRLAVAWSMGTLLLGGIGLATGETVAFLGPALLALGVAVVGLAGGEAAAAFALLTGGAVAGILLPSLTTESGRKVEAGRFGVAVQGTSAFIGAGLLALGIVAWGASPAGPLGGSGLLEPDDPAAQVALGVALVGVVIAVVLRTGAIPVHVWAARFMEGVSPLAVPAALAWGSAAFTLTAIAWTQAALGAGSQETGVIEHDVIALIAVASVVLGGIAALLHDDVEHVLGYSILQDVGLAVFAFASLRPEVGAAARDWLLASAAVKTALAGWVAAIRWWYGVHRVADLGGWVRRAPALGIAFGAIILGSVGLPGMAVFDARITLVGEAVPGLPGFLVLVVALSPVVSLGRVLGAGFGLPSAAIAGAPSGRPRWPYDRTAAWTRSSLLAMVRVLPEAIRVNVRTGVGLAALGLAAIGLVLAIVGAGGGEAAA